MQFIFKPYCQVRLFLWGCFLRNQNILLIIYIKSLFQVSKKGTMTSIYYHLCKRTTVVLPQERKVLPWEGTSLRHWNSRLVSSGVSLTSSKEGASLALVGHPSSDGITIKVPYGVDVWLHWPDSYPIFSYWVG